MLISKMEYSDFVKLAAVANDRTKLAASMEEAGQKLAESIFDFLQDSIVLLRVFVSFYQKDLPGSIQSFAQKLASGAGLTLTPESHILTLMGTKGLQPEWNRREQSNGHIGIPLASEEFVGAIPMMSALLEQLEFPLGWIRGDSQIVSQKIGNIAGTFYVEDAATTKDNKGRHIIAAQDFVERYNVKTVFGVGGGYTLTDNFMVMICFLNESLEKNKANWFQALSNSFKINTTELINKPNKFFA